jgi:hypothetical protein
MRRETSAGVVCEMNLPSNGFLAGYIVRRNGIIVRASRSGFEPGWRNGQTQGS